MRKVSLSCRVEPNFLLHYTLSAYNRRVVELFHKRRRGLKNFLLFLVFIQIWVNSCSEKEFTKDPAESFAIAKEPYDDGDYDIALAKLGEFKSRFPYSQYAIEAELLIANAHFEKEEYEEASSAYAQFAKLHPKHAEVTYALFRVGESYWLLSPEDIDREQEFTHKAIEEWQKLITRYPDSSYAKKAKTLVESGKRRIAESFEFVADFYCKLEIYHACAFRFIDLARNYPEFKDLREKALTKASDALDIVATQKQEDPKSDKNIYFNTMSAQEIQRLASDLRKQLKDKKS